MQILTELILILTFVFAIVVLGINLAILLWLSVWAIKGIRELKKKDE